MRIDPEALLEDLELACADVTRGAPPGPSMAKSLERICVGVLQRHGLRGARAIAQSTRRGTHVKILIPGPGKRVQQLVLTFD